MSADVTTAYEYDGHSCTAETTNGITKRYAAFEGQPLW